MNKKYTIIGLIVMAVAIPVAMYLVQYSNADNRNMAQGRSCEDYGCKDGYECQPSGKCVKIPTPTLVMGCENYDICDLGFECTNNRCVKIPRKERLTPTPIVRLTPTPVVGCENISGKRGIRRDKSMVWLSLNNLDSARCVCGEGNFYQEPRNNKFYCGQKDAGLIALRCDENSEKPVDFCTNKLLYIEPTCVGGKWKYNGQVCDAPLRVEDCNGQQYCCPGVGGVWTTDMAQCL